MGASSTATTVKSATRVIEVLEFFRDHREPRSLKQLTEALGYPQSSTTVLLKSLVTLGYINYDRVRRVYFPTLRVASLGDWISQALLGQGRLLEAMRDVHNGTGETVSIAVQNDVYMQYIRVIQASHPLRFYPEMAACDRSCSPVWAGCRCPPGPTRRWNAWCGAPTSRSRDRPTGSR